jgi:hypothetical protein
MAAALAALVNQPGEQFLARAGLPLDQQVEIGITQRGHHVAQAADRGGRADQRAAGAVLRQGLEPAVFQRQGAGMGGALDRRDQRVGGEGLGQEIPHPGLERIDRHVHVTMAGDQDHGQFRIAGVERAKQVDAGKAGHAHVADHHAGNAASSTASAVGASAKVCTANPARRRSCAVEARRSASSSTSATRRAGSAAASVMVRMPAPG